MNKCTRLFLCSFVFLVLLSTGSASYSAPADKSVPPKAQGNVTEVYGGGEVMLTVLTDKLHALTSTLKSKTTYHYFAFSAVRGQDVILTALEPDPVKQFWKVEYLEGANWIVKTGIEPKTFTSLSVGAAVMIRISYKDDYPFRDQAYDFVFGSYPVLSSYKLYDEPNVNRIPIGHSEPSYFNTQAYISARLIGHFTDTRDAPLEGAIADFNLFVKNSTIPSITDVFVSDSAGRVSKTYDFSRCSGGHEAKDYDSYNYGFNTWRSYYNVGGYFLHNRLVGVLSEEQMMDVSRTFAHICSQRLVKSVPART